MVSKTQEPVDCAEHAISFACGIPLLDAEYRLWRAGRPVDHDGTTDRQLSRAVRDAGRNPVGHRTTCKTLRGFARGKFPGAYIVFTCDHVVAVVNGFLCDRPENSDLARIEKVWKIL